MRLMHFLFYYAFEEDGKKGWRFSEKERERKRVGVKVYI